MIAGVIDHTGPELGHVSAVFLIVSDQSGIEILIVEGDLTVIILQVQPVCRYVIICQAQCGAEIACYGLLYTCQGAELVA